MAQPFPYTYYACNCFDSHTRGDEEERTFDPRSPRANYALAPLSVNSVENPDAPSATGGPYILACSYCHWSTAETGIEFEKHTGIYSQLSRIANGGDPIPTQKDRDKERERNLKELEDKRTARHSARSPTEHDNSKACSRDDLFSNLNAFYKTQIDAQTPSNPFAAHDLSFNSPSAYSRIMNLYSTTSKSKKREKPPPMREAAAELEGLSIHDPASDTAAIERLKKDGWSSTLSPTQKLAQANPHVQFEDQLRPVATLLCTKRSKRCRSCRQILSKPESKIIFPSTSLQL